MDIENKLPEEDQSEEQENNDRSSPSNPSSNGRGEKKEAKNEVKQNKKENIDKNDQKAKGKDDALNQQHSKDKGLGLLSKKLKAVREAKRGERLKAAKTLAKSAIKKKVLQAAKKGLIAGGNTIAPGLGTATGFAIDHPKTAAIIVVLAITLPIIILTMVFSAFTSSLNTSGEGDSVFVSGSCPHDAIAGGVAECSINVSYPGEASDILISIDLPPGTEYIDSVPEATFDGKTISWSLIGPNPLPNAKLSNVNTTLLFHLRGSGVPSASLPIAYSIVPFVESETPIQEALNNSGCDGSTPNNPHGNFGNPNCDFNKNELGKILRREDPANAYKWDAIIACESTYNPNAYNPNSSSGKGAYGLLQMNPAQQRTDIYRFDAGNVNWNPDSRPLGVAAGAQVTNAINYNTIGLKGSFKYWECRKAAGIR